MAGGGRGAVVVGVGVTAAILFVGGDAEEDAEAARRWEETYE